MGSIDRMSRIHRIGSLFDEDVRQQLIVFPWRGEVKFSSTLTVESVKSEMGGQPYAVLNLNGVCVEIAIGEQVNVIWELGEHDE